MRGRLTRWLFAMGLTLFLTGGWALQHTVKLRADSPHAANAKHKKSQRPAGIRITKDF